MTGTDFIALAPLLATALAAVVVLLVLSFVRSHRATLALTLVGMAIAGATIRWAATATPRQVTPILIIDGYALFFFGLLLAASCVVALFAFQYLERRGEHNEEFYFLLIVATLGAMVLTASSHFVSLFLGLEVLSVAIYGLIAYMRKDPLCVEAGIKYLILAGASSAFLVFGMALVYAELGTMEFGPMAAGLVASNELGLVLPGLALMLTGVGFKLAVVPFHMWTPEIYQGAPTPVAAFVATVSKGGMFALVLRYFAGLEGVDLGPIVWILVGLAIASMLIGNLLALLESNVKRILAYSSIAHIGYVMVALLADTELRAEAVTLYLVAYFITTLTAFGVIMVLSDDLREAERVEDYRGLFWRRPWLASLMTAALLSLAGIPLTAGFLGKFSVVAAGVDGAAWWLVLSLVLGSAIGLFYYLRLVVVMFGQAPEAEADRTWPDTSGMGAAAGIALVALTASLFWVGVHPAALIDLIHASVAP